MIRVIIAPLCATALLATAALSQQDFDNVEIKAAHIGGNVHMLEGSGGNIGVSAGEDGILIVDDQFAPLAEKIQKALADINPGDLKFVLNTHWHFDHTGGNPIFGRKAPIVSHANVRKRLTTPQTLFGQKRDPLPKEGWPVITFRDAISIHFNGEEIRLMHFPNAHTDGDCVVFFPKSNVVHLGDLFFNGMFPFVDIDHGGDVVGLTSSVQLLLMQIPADMKIIPGHGPASNLEELGKYHAMLVATTKVVRDAIKTDKSLEEIKSAGLGDEWKSWGEGFIKTDRWIEIIHASLSR